MNKLRNKYFLQKKLNYLFDDFVNFLTIIVIIFILCCIIFGQIPALNH